MSPGKKRIPPREIAVISLFAAMTAVMTQLIIPLQPVPFSFGIFGVMLCAVVLPLRLALLSQLTFLLLGAFGAPVFTYFSGGFHKLVGPTGGYLIGYLALTLTVGLLKGRFPGAGVGRLTLFCALGMLACHTFGALWLAVGLGYTPVQAFLLGSAPYLAFDLIKAAGAGALGVRIRQSLGRAGIAI